MWLTPGRTSGHNEIAPIFFTEGILRREVQSHRKTDYKPMMYMIKMFVQSNTTQQKVIFLFKYSKIIYPSQRPSHWPTVNFTEHLYIILSQAIINSFFSE